LFGARDQRGVYLVVDARTWWPGRVVLVPFELVGAPDLTAGTLPLHLEGDRSEPLLHSARELAGYRVRAEDGELGRVRDLLFGDEWRVRALVVETGDWLFPERVAVPVRAIAELSSTEQVVRLNLTRAEVRR